MQDSTGVYGWGVNDGEFNRYRIRKRAHFSLYVCFCTSTTQRMSFCFLTGVDRNISIEMVSPGHAQMAK